MFNRYTSFLSLVCPTKNIYLHQADDKRNLFCIIFFFRCAKNFPSYFYSLGIVYDRLSLTNRVITIFCWMLWNALTQINDRWQTFTEVKTTADLVFQHNQRLICYRLKFLLYMYIIFLYIFIEVKQKCCHFLESFVYLGYLENTCHWEEKKSWISFLLLI